MERNQIDRGQMRKLEDWVGRNKVQLEGEYQGGFSSVAKRAAQDLDFVVTAGNLRGAARVMGVVIKRKRTGAGPLMERLARLEARVEKLEAKESGNLLMPGLLGSNGVGA